MRLDHIAYRTRNRHETADFFKKIFGYKIADEFQIKFDNDTTADCIALAPPQARYHKHECWVHKALMPPHSENDPADAVYECELHAPHEIFVSDGAEGSIVADWVASKNGGKGGIHHMAYNVDNIVEEVASWKEAGVEFLSEDPMSCPGLKQIFTTENELTGVIYELIQREGSEGKAFCKENVKALMESTTNV
tara:strand:+ start:1462 stop:2040 length:579 start_codon:yes stop_codon:yes gene_type:complete